MLPLEVETLRAIVARAMATPSGARQSVARCGISENDFTDGPPRDVFRALEKRLDARAFISPSALVSALGRRSPEAVALAHEVCAPSGIGSDMLEEVAQRLRHERRRAGMEGVFVEALDRLRSGTPQEVVERAVRDALDENRGAGWGRMVSLREVIGGEILQILHDAEAGRGNLLQTGMEPLDALITGLPRTLVVIGADAGVGKTGFALRFGANVAGNGGRVGVWALEDPKRKMALRLVAAGAGVSLGAILGGKAEAVSAAHESAGKIHQTELADRLFFREHDGPLATLLASDVEAQIVDERLELVLIDNSNEVVFESGGDDRKDEKIDRLLKRLRKTAERHGAVVVVITHLRRTEDDTQAQPIRQRHFAHSMGMVRIPRAVIGLRQPRRGVLAVDVVKANELPLGTVELEMNGSAAMPLNTEAPPPPKTEKQIEREAKQEEKKQRKAKQKGLDLGGES